ncbi:MAG: Mrp/NBP35 family ATP-binding protein [Rubricoccaceae bacterium]|nr:Mrp/NBP35 family ATP-binding protein [Rubricoccaceae bacterium]
MALTRDAVLAALSTVEEPDLGRDLVSLDMVRDLDVDGTAVTFTVVLTTPACPLKDLIRNRCVAAIHRDVDPDAEVTVNMEANVTTPAGRAAGPDAMPPAMAQGAARVKNFIAVASGKGGVGKSTVAANLAVALAQEGAAVGLLDADIYGPSVPMMFGVPADERPEVNDDRKIVPLERYGVKLLSMGFLVDAYNAVVWRGPMVARATRQFLGDADWGELDYLVLDLPPGTGDIQLTVVQTIPLTGAVIVSTPQPVALADARKGVAMFEKVNVPVLGLVENMAFFSPPDLPDRKYYLFGEGGARRLAEELKVPLLGEVPIEEALRESGDRGAPIVVREPESASAAALRLVAEHTAQQVSIRNAEQPPTQQVEILYR